MPRYPVFSCRAAASAAAARSGRELAEREAALRRREQSVVCREAAVDAAEARQRDTGAALAARAAEIARREAVFLLEIDAEAKRRERRLARQHSGPVTADDAAALDRRGGVVAMEGSTPRLQGSVEPEGPRRTVPHIFTTAAAASGVATAKARPRVSSAASDVPCSDYNASSALAQMPAQPGGAAAPSRISSARSSIVGDELELIFYGEGSRTTVDNDDSCESRTAAGAPAPTGQNIRRCNSAMSVVAAAQRSERLPQVAAGAGRLPECAVALGVSPTTFSPGALGPVAGSKRRLRSVSSIDVPGTLNAVQQMRSPQTARAIVRTGVDDEDEEVGGSSSSSRARGPWSRDEAAAAAAAATSSDRPGAGNSSIRRLHDGGGRRSSYYSASLSLDGSGHEPLAVVILPPPSMGLTSPSLRGLQPMPVLTVAQEARASSHCGNAPISAAGTVASDSRNKQHLLNLRPPPEPSTPLPTVGPVPSPPAPFTLLTPALGGMGISTERRHHEVAQTSCRRALSLPLCGTPPVVSDQQAQMPQAATPREFAAAAQQVAVQRGGARQRARGSSGSGDVVGHFPAAVAGRLAEAGIDAVNSNERSSRQPPGSCAAVSATPRGSFQCLETPTIADARVTDIGGAAAPGVDFSYGLRRLRSNAGSGQHNAAGPPV